MPLNGATFTFKRRGSWTMWLFGRALSRLAPTCLASWPRLPWLTLLKDCAGFDSTIAAGASSPKRVFHLMTTTSPHQECHRHHKQAAAFVVPSQLFCDCGFFFVLSTAAEISNTITTASETNASYLFSCSFPPPLALLTLAKGTAFPRHPTTEHQGLRTHPATSACSNNQVAQEENAHSTLRFCWRPLRSLAYAPPNRNGATTEFPTVRRRLLVISNIHRIRRRWSVGNGCPDCLRPCWTYQRRLAAKSCGTTFLPNCM